MRLPDSLREQLRIPLGTLLPESRADRENVKSHLPENPYIITVGDRTTEKMIDFGLIPSLQITDGLEKREQREPPNHANATELTVENPAAEIVPSTIKVIKKAFTMPPPIRLNVHGEEDLLVIPACIYAPENAIVMYGQPDEGLVIIKVTPEIRNKTQALLDLME